MKKTLLNWLRLEPKYTLFNNSVILAVPGLFGARTPVSVSDFLFPTPVQTDLSSCTMGIWILFRS